MPKFQQICWLIFRHPEKILTSDLDVVTNLVPVVDGHGKLEWNSQEKSWFTLYATRIIHSSLRKNEQVARLLGWRCAMNHTISRYN